jgi:hypothetical protein
MRIFVKRAAVRPKKWQLRRAILLGPMDRISNATPEMDDGWPRHTIQLVENALIRYNPSVSFAPILILSLLIEWFKTEQVATRV